MKRVIAVGTWMALFLACASATAATSPRGTTMAPDRGQDEGQIKIPCPDQMSAEIDHPPSGWSPTATELAANKAMVGDFMGKQLLQCVYYPKNTPPSGAGLFMLRMPVPADSCTPTPHELSFTCKRGTEASP